MSDLLTATQDAVFAVLFAGVDPDLAAVVQHILEDQKPPFIIVGDIEATPGDTKGSEDHTVTIGFVYEGEDRRQLFAMMHAARDALEGAPLTADGAELEPAVWLSSGTFAADGTEVYDSEQRYQVIAEQA